MDFFSVNLLIAALSASRFLERAGAVAYSGIGHELGRADRLGAAFPDPSAGRGDVDIAVRGLEHAGRNAGWMVVAGLLRNILFHQPARSLKIQHEDLCLQQRGMHPLAFAGNIALQECCEDADGAERPARR